MKPIKAKDLLELVDKITPQQAHQQIKKMYKELKKLRKDEKNTWQIDPN
jgi:hypothetical protein